jgi:hypothetical protein
LAALGKLGHVGLGNYEVLLGAIFEAAVGVKELVLYVLIRTGDRR